MSFSVKFWNFDKKFNSTKRPSGTGLEFNCILKDGSGIITPSIRLNTPDPVDYNYCYIQHFNRYYYVREWFYDEGFWTANLECDVLATYKTVIGSSNLYILRAAGAYNGDIIDTLYPTKTNCDFHTDLLNVPYTTGCYILGLVSKLGAYGSIAYYVMDSANMARFVNALMDDVVLEQNGFSWNDASQALQLSLVDPVQYIKSVLWCPFDMTDLTYTAATQLQIYNWTLPNINCGMLYGKTLHKTYSFTLTKHPDTQSRGNYVNCKPYTNITLNFPPFGNIEIDTTATVSASSLDLDLDYDIFTGEAQLRVFVNGIVINQLNTKLAVPVQISQVTRDYISAATSFIGGAAGAITGAITGGAAGIAGAIGSWAGGIADAAKSFAPRANSIGANGNYTIVNFQPRMDYQFFRPVNDDPTHNGRPLCEKRVINTLSGYMLVQDGDVEIDGTRSEAEQIQNLLQGGFYYE